MPRRINPRMMAGEADILETLKRLDEEVAQASESNGQRLKTPQELAAAAAVKQQAGKVSVFGARLDDDVSQSHIHHPHSHTHTHVGGWHTCLSVCASLSLILA